MVPAEEKTLVLSGNVRIALSGTPVENKLAPVSGVREGHASQCDHAEVRSVLLCPSLCLCLHLCLCLSLSLPLSLSLSLSLFMSFSLSFSRSACRSFYRCVVFYLYVFRTVVLLFMSLFTVCLPFLPPFCHSVMHFSVMSAIPSLFYCISLIPFVLSCFCGPYCS